MRGDEGLTTEILVLLVAASVVRGGDAVIQLSPGPVFYLKGGGWWWREWREASLEGNEESKENGGFWG